MPYFTLQTKCQILFCCAQCLACPLDSNTLHPPACPCLVPDQTIYFCLKISHTKTPTYSQHTKTNTVPTKRIKGQPDKNRWLGEQHTSAPKCGSSGQTLPWKWQKRRQGKAKPKCHLLDWFTVSICHWNYISCSFWHHQEMLQCHETRSRVTSGEI